MAAEFVSFKSGEIIFSEGANSREMFVVKNGQIKIFKQKGQTEIELGTVGAGEIFGEMAFFDGKPRSASATAVINSELILIRFEDMQKKYSELPMWLKKIIASINDRLREADRRIKHLEKQATLSYSGSGKRREVSGETGYEFLDEHEILVLSSIVLLTTNQYGLNFEGNKKVALYQVREMCVKIFQESQGKLTALIQALVNTKVIEVVKEGPPGEEKNFLILRMPQALQNFVDFYQVEFYGEAKEKLNLTKQMISVLEVLFTNLDSATKEEDKVLLNLKSIEAKIKEMKSSEQHFDKIVVEELVNLKILNSFKIFSADQEIVEFSLKKIEYLYWPHAIYRACEKINQEKKEGLDANKH